MGCARRRVTTFDALATSLAAPCHEGPRQGQSTRSRSAGNITGPCEVVQGYDDSRQWEVPVRLLTESLDRVDTVVHDACY